MIQFLQSHVKCRGSAVWHHYNTTGRNTIFVQCSLATRTPWRRSFIIQIGKEVQSIYIKKKVLPAKSHSPLITLPVAAEHHSRATTLHVTAEYHSSATTLRAHSYVRLYCCPSKKQFVANHYSEGV